MKTRTEKDSGRLVHEAKWAGYVVSASLLTVGFLCVFFLFGGHWATAIAMRISWHWRFLFGSAMLVGIFAPYLYLFVRVAAPRIAVPLAVLLAVAWAIVGLVCAPPDS
jgi:hypothetical protein